MPTQRKLLALGCALALALPAAEAAKLYRWVDEDGQVHFTDKVPTDEGDKARTEIDRRTGVVVDQVEAAKSRDELVREAERQKELEKLRAEQQRLIGLEKAKDDALLRTFASLDDILIARDNKIAAVDVKSEVIRADIARIKSELEDYQRMAADSERQGKGVGKDLLKRMEDARGRLNGQYAQLIGNEKEKEQLVAEFKESLERFRTLKKLATPSDQKAEEEKVRVSLLEDSVVPCPDDKECARLWSAAEVYLRAHNTTRVQMVSESVMMTAPPQKDEDISLTISRIADRHGNGFYIFMDLQCNSKTPRGADFCKGPKVAEVRKGFVPSLTGKK